MQPRGDSPQWEIIIIGYLPIQRKRTYSFHSIVDTTFFNYFLVRTGSPGDGGIYLVATLIGGVFNVTFNGGKQPGHWKKNIFL